MKKPFLVFAMAATLVSGAHAQSTFRDVPDNHWAAAAVKRLVEAGIIVGRPASSVSASGNRQELNPILVVPLLKTALGSNTALSQQTINVYSVAPTKKQAGTVTLIGTVKNQAQRTLAATIARNMAPDYMVVNKLKIVAARSSRSR